MFNPIKAIKRHYQQKKELRALQAEQAVLAVAPLIYTPESFLACANWWADRVDISSFGAIRAVEAARLKPDTQEQILELVANNGVQIEEKPGLSQPQRDIFVTTLVGQMEAAAIKRITLINSGSNGPIHCNEKELLKFMEPSTYPIGLGCGYGPCEELGIALDSIGIKGRFAQGTALPWKTSTDVRPKGKITVVDGIGPKGYFEPREVVI